MEKREPSYTVGGDESWCSHVEKSMWKKVFLRKLRIGLPHDPAIPLLGYYPDETIIQKVTCTLKCIAAIFTITKTRK